MNWFRWLEHAEKFLATSKIRYDFSHCDGPTLWDILWEEHNQRNGCSGHISDYVERDVEYRVKELAPGGEYRESYEEYLKREELEDSPERRQQWALDDVSDHMQTYAKSEDKKSRKSKCGRSLYFDFIEDIDDDIEVAGIFDAVKLTKSETARLKRIYERMPDTYEKWRRVYIARKLVREVVAIAEGRNGELKELADVAGLCWNCLGPMFDEDRGEDDRRPDASEVLSCPDCGSLSTRRDVAAVFRYTVEGCVNGVDYHRYRKIHVLDFDPPLPGERADIWTLAQLGKRLVTRLSFPSIRRLWSWVERLSGQAPRFGRSEQCHLVLKALDDTRCRYVGYAPLAGLECILGFHVDGKVTMSDVEDSDVFKAPTEAELEACRDVLLQFGAPEARDHERC
jgi:hypothetical protein